MWQKELPKKPGRYWWKSKDEYGIALLQYNRHHYVPEFVQGKPKVEIRSVIIFDHGTWSGETNGEGWSLCAGAPDKGLMFWDEVVKGPRGLFKMLPGPPKPPTKEEIQKRSRRNKKRQKKIDLERRLAKKARADQLQEALVNDLTLYECPSCEDFYWEDELGTLRECSAPSCGERFFVDFDEARNCTSCNRPFTRLEEERVCPSCEEGQCEIKVDKGNLVG
jgi:hypothetical protein